MSNALIARYRRARRDQNLCVLEGLHTLKHALRFGAELQAVHSLANAPWTDMLQSHAHDVAPTILENTETISESTFRELAPKAPDTGIIAIARRPAPNLEEVWCGQQTGTIILLDHPSHPGNAGAIIRTAAAASARAVLTTGPLDPWNPAVMRGSAGLHFALTVAKVDQAMLPDLPIIGLDDAGIPIDQADIPQTAIFALGSERHGLSPELRQRMAWPMALPMQPGVSSLNMSAAAAILLYHQLLCASRQ